MEEPKEEEQNQEHRLLTPVHPPGPGRPPVRPRLGRSHGPQGMTEARGSVPPSLLRATTGQS